MITQDSPQNTTKDRLIAALQTAREELKRAKNLIDTASAKGELDHPDGAGAQTTAMAEYDSAVNHYRTAVNNFADLVLTTNCPEQ